MPFIDPSEFFVPELTTLAVYNAGAGEDDAEIGVIFNAPGTREETSDGVAYRNTNFEALCQQADVSDAGKGSTLQVEGTTFYVIDTEPDGEGCIRLILSKDPVI